jgi:hypothetical protein
LRDLLLDERVDLLFEPVELTRIAENPLTHGRAVDHSPGLDPIPPALLERREQGLAIEQVVHDPVGRDSRCPKTPEGLERR